MMRENLYWQEASLRLDSLVVYRRILEDGVVKSFLELCRRITSESDVSEITVRYYEFLTRMLAKAEALGLKGNLFGKYVTYLYLNDENELSLACERKESVEKSTLYELALRDVSTLHYFSGFDIKNISDNIGGGEDISNYKPIHDHEDPYLEEVLQAARPADKFKALLWRYQRMGAGDMAMYRMYRISRREHGLVGLAHTDPVVFGDIIGLDTQKTLLRNNTEDFLAGRSANNMLLAGSRGSGKSSCVKALANAYADQGLRLIEARKDQAPMLPRLMGELARRGKYYIIFMDDLSYEHFETQYKYLKSLLEGSVETKPRNVLFCATSNRRHIVRESFEDRNGPPRDEEIHAADTVNEKLSLFDRFGITVTFPNTTRDEYIQIARALADKRNLKIDPVFLAEQAVKWSVSQKSMSGRTARQFVDHIAGEITRV